MRMWASGIRRFLALDFIQMSLKKLKQFVSNVFRCDHHHRLVTHCNGVIPRVGDHVLSRVIPRVGDHVLSRSARI